MDSAGMETVMAVRREEEENPIIFLEDDEAHAFFDSEARRIMGMSGEEFLRRYDAGEFNDQMDGPRHVELVHMVMLLPFAR